MEGELKTICLKKQKSSCNVDCDQLSNTKQLLNKQDVALGAVNIGSATGTGQNTLVHLLFYVSKDISTFLQFDLACGGCSGVLQYNSTNFNQEFTTLMRTLATGATC